VKRLHASTRALYLERIEKLAEEISKQSPDNEKADPTLVGLASGYATALGRCQAKGETILGLVSLLK
jgi:hypothetical protein